MPARKYNNAKRKVAKKYKTTVKKATAATKTIQAVVRRALAANIETKQACLSTSDYQQIGHNSFIALEAGTLLGMTQGVQDNQISTTQVRIGDQINLKGISIRMMLELNERYSDVSYRILCVRFAKGDTPTASTLWHGLSGNKMLDTIDRERYTILFEKWGKIRAAPLSMGVGAESDGTSTGIYKNGNTQNQASRATKIVKMWLPASKFAAKYGIIQYENNTGQVKTYDYSILIYAYANYNTSSALGYNVLAVNDYVKQIYFKYV